MEPELESEALELELDLVLGIWTAQDEAADEEDTNLQRGSAIVAPNLSARTVRATSNT